VEIREITTKMAAVEATFRESVTYVMKAEYVWDYLRREHRGF
jgi:hypothetical protein